MTKAINLIPKKIDVERSINQIGKAIEALLLISDGLGKNYVGDAVGFVGYELRRHYDDLRLNMDLAPRESD